MPAVARLYRHPVKALGAEEIASAELSAGRTLPFDRAWAVEHEAARPGTGWRNCNNFVRGAKSPALMAVTAATDEATGRVTFRHPNRPEITLDPDTEGAALVDWARPICDPNRAMPARLVRAEERGMTDSDYPSVAILNLASLRALETRAGRPLDPRRFRGNVWLEGAEPWQEFDWVGRRLALGSAEVEVRARIGRCVATHADPETGVRDTDILGLLESGWDHTDFGVYAVVTGSGRVAVGDQAWPL